MLDIKKHELILVQILQDIYSTKEIGRVLGFKGGTAAYLFFNLPRFSIDLDFNLLDEGKKHLVFDGLEQIVRKYGTVKQAREKRFTVFFLLSYGEKDVNIKVEISKRRLESGYELKNYLGLSMLVMKQQDMFANKLVDLLGRKAIANRDLFDLWYFFKNDWPLNIGLVEQRAGSKLKSYLRQCIKAVELVDERYVLQGLGEVLDAKQKVWVKAKLKQELIFLMRHYLKSER